MKKKTGKLRVRIIGILLGVTLLISFITAAMLYRYFSRVMEERLEASGRQRFDEMVQDMNQVYQEAVNFGQHISISEDMRAFVQKTEYDTIAEEMIANREAAEELSRMLTLSDYIKSMALVRDGQVLVWTELQFWDKESRLILQDWYQVYSEAVGEIQETQRAISLPYTYAMKKAGRPVEHHLLTVHIPLIIAKGDYGSILINVDMEKIDEVLDKYQDDFEHLELVFQEPGLAEMGSESRETMFRQETELNGILKADLQYPVPEISSWRENAVLVIEFLVVFLAGMAIITVGMLHLTRPVKVLVQAMREVGEGCLETRVEIHTNNEFETLGHALNRMVRHLKTYFEASLESQKQLMEMEYELLVAQINPHFIYNTLNSMVYLAKKGRNEDVVKITQALIELLQDGIRLSGDKNMSAIQNELNIIRNYIWIQNFRYMNQFTFVEHCPEELALDRIPSSIIQPIVENALFHGIVPTGEPGTITLSITEEEAGEEMMLHICVEDDGVGASQEKLDEICAGKVPPADGPHKHIGIQNVIKRLELLYPGNYQFYFRSREGEGTQAHIYIPHKAMPEREPEES